MMMTSGQLTTMRRENGMTQGELAKAVGVSQSYIARIESGTLDPKLSVVNRIVETLSKRKGFTCGDIMTPDPVSVDARDSVSTAIPIMRRRGFSQLPVVRSGRVVGIVTERDIIRHLGRDLTQISVQTIMDPVSPPMFDEKTPLKSILTLFDSFQAVLVQKQGRLTGVVTRADALKSAMRPEPSKS
ncbi:MAG: transcriptional regulator [Candidatus Thorarchaeota archaeon]|nr:MAG: transcriptional regulator [Candidatus Thorarchaeota archaeon]